jgi:hypothetical protein
VRQASTLSEHKKAHRAVPHIALPVFNPSCTFERLNCSRSGPGCPLQSTTSSNFALTVQYQRRANAAPTTARSSKADQQPKSRARLRQVPYRSSERRSTRAISEVEASIRRDQRRANAAPTTARSSKADQQLKKSSKATTSAT